MSSSNTEKTFFGFWPTDDNYFAVDEEEAKDDDKKDAIQKSLKETLAEYESQDWQMIVCNDYLLLLHLKPLEDPLNDEREHNDTSEIYDLRLGTSRQVTFQYVESLNALYFLFYASCFTGRNNYILHDFSEVTKWQCLRVMYSNDNKPQRRIQFGRGTKKELYRRELYSLEDSQTFFKIDINTFSDTAHYWGIIFNLKLIPLAAVGSKIISEHRLESYDLSVVLVWFEIENWINSNARNLGVSTTTTNPRTGRIRYHGIAEIIDDFPLGTSIANLASELHSVRVVRNNIAHNGTIPSHQQSAEAIELFIKMFNMRTGLNLRVDTHQTPTGGI